MDSVFFEEAIRDIELLINRASNVKMTEKEKFDVCDQFLKTKPLQCLQNLFQYRQTCELKDTNSQYSKIYSEFLRTIIKIASIENASKIRKYFLSNEGIKLFLKELIAMVNLPAEEADQYVKESISILFTTFIIVASEFRFANQEKDKFSFKLLEVLRIGLLFG